MKARRIGVRARAVAAVPAAFAATLSEVKYPGLSDCFPYYTTAAAAAGIRARSARLSHSRERHGRCSALTAEHLRRLSSPEPHGGRGTGLATHSSPLSAPCGTQCSTREGARSI